MRRYNFHTIQQSLTRVGLVLLWSTLPISSLVSAAERTSNTEQLENRIDALQAQVDSLSNTAATKHEIGLPIHGFSDVNFVHDTQHANGTQSGFALGNFDLYMAPNLGNRMRALVELNFEYSSKDGSLGTDLERLEYGYTFNDAFTLWAGRFHTPYGYWNTAFHHGAQMQLSTRRPQFIDFEDGGGILPAHSVGLDATGRWRAGPGKLNYDLYIANGSRIADGTMDFNAYKDNDSNKLIGGNLKYVLSGAVEGLSIGIHAFTERVSSYNNNIWQTTTTVNMTGAYAVFEGEQWQVMSEYYHFNNHDESGVTGAHSSWAGYAQAGFRINQVTPFVRYEKASLDQADRYFADQESGRSYERQSLGVRYDLNHQVALKAEYGHSKDVLRLGDSTPASWDRLQLQFCVAF